MNTQSYKENENPFAYDPEHAQMDNKRNREAPFSFFADDGTAAEPQRAGNSASNVESTSKVVKLQRWNIVLRLATCIFCLATVLLVVLARQTKSGIQLNDGSTATGTATYKFSGSFKFLILVNFLVLLYALLMSGVGIVMWKKGLGHTTPPSLMWVAFSLNLVTSGFLLLAFASAVAVEVVARQGLTLRPIRWDAICHHFGFFCFTNELALAAAALAYLCLALSTGIDAYFIHLRKLREA